MNRLSTSASLLYCVAAFSIKKLLVFLVIVSPFILVDCQDESNDADLWLDANPQFYSDEQSYIVDSSNNVEDTQSVIGALFNVRFNTKSNLMGGSSNRNTTIYFTGLEFYVSSSPVFYEVYTKVGEYNSEELTDLSQWDLISTGLLNAVKAFSLLALPSEDFIIPNTDDADATPSYRFTLEGEEATRSFYVAIASNDLVLLPGVPSEPPDTRVIASTPELELYEGVGAQSYPYDPKQQMSSPMGFIGRISYQAEGGVESTGTTQQPSAFPSQVNTALPSLRPSDALPSLLPSLIVEESPIANIETTTTRQTQSPAITSVPSLSPSISDQPTMKPTSKRCRPGRLCSMPSNPPTTPPEPTTSPSERPPQQMTVEVIAVLENVPDRSMIEREIDKYVEVLDLFLQQREELIRSGLVVEEMEVFYHSLLKSEPMKMGKGSGGTKQTTKRLLNATTTHYVYNYNTPISESSFKPKTYPAVYIMTKIDVTASLPYDVVAFFLWNELTVHEQSLVQLFHHKSMFVSYFRDVSNITFQVVDDMTIPPSPSPTVFLEINAVEEDGSVNNNIFGGSLLVYVGVFVGLLWCFLTCCSLRYISKHRQRFKEQNKLKETTGIRIDRSVAATIRVDKEQLTTRVNMGLANMSLKRRAKQLSWDLRSSVKGNKSDNIRDDDDDHGELDDIVACSDEVKGSPKPQSEDEEGSSQSQSDLLGEIA